jgi:putative membrane protein insertion efficiency factor
MGFWMLNLKKFWRASTVLVNKPAVLFALFSVRAYQLLLSSFMGGNCRFYPSCSCYAEEAFRKHNFITASYLVARRLWSCRPFGAQGYDPVPEGIHHV